ncbi:MAG: hypothetical protein HFE86_00870 [Clostridiales bacterium]|nr:hypothetical protein [Clostridiales bacterium]
MAAALKSVLKREERRVFVQEQGSARRKPQERLSPFENFGRCKRLFMDKRTFFRRFKKDSRGRLKTLSSFVKGKRTFLHSKNKYKTIYLQGIIRPVAAQRAALTGGQKKVSIVFGFGSPLDPTAFYER